MDLRSLSPAVATPNWVQLGARGGPGTPCQSVEPRSVRRPIAERTLMGASCDQSMNSSGVVGSADRPQFSPAETQAPD